LGANSYLIKPADLQKREHLIRMVKEYWLELNCTSTHPETALRIAR
jgi:hypothetical protein